MAKRSERAIPPGYVVLDGKWARQQASEALSTFVAPIKGAADFIVHGPRGGSQRHISTGPDKFRKS